MKIIKPLSIVLILVLANVSNATILDEAINKNAVKSPWWKHGKNSLKKRLSIKQNNNRAKNVILFIGDGMGISTITAARIFDGQSRGQSGEENLLSWEHFPYTALIKPYNTDAQVPDSAATASAMTTGVKTKFRTVATWGYQTSDDCFGPQKKLSEYIS